MPNLSHGIETSDLEPREAEVPSPKTTGARRLSLTHAALTGVIVMALIVGTVLGALLMRQRYHAGDVLVSVNGTVIRRADYQARLDAVTHGAVLRRMVQETLEAQYARQRGLTPRETEVQAQYDGLARRPGFIARNEALGLSPEDVKRDLRIQMTQDAVVTQGKPVTEAALQAYYHQNTDPANPRARFYQPETIQVAVIVTGTEAESREARALLDTGVPFADVVHIYSHDVSRNNEGLLPPITRGRSHAGAIPGLEKALFSLQPGQISGPAQFKGLWWIMNCRSRQPAMTLPYTQVRDTCRVAVAQKSGGAARLANTGFAAFEHRANIRAFNPQYERLFGGDRL